MKYKSDIMETIHENATANFEIGAISKAKMREYDEMCLVPETEDFGNSQQTENPDELDHISFATV